MPRLNRVALLGLLLGGFVYSQSPQIWFGPLDDISRQGQAFRGSIPSNDGGPTDFMNLFAPGALWTQAASHVSVFMLNGEGIAGNQFGSFSDSQLQEIFSFLKQHNIALAVEFGPLIPSGGCGVGTEGFAGTAAQTIVDRIQANGGTLNYWVMDEPFQHANDACNWTAQQIATNALTSLNLLKAAFPGLLIGDVEIVPDIFSPRPDWLQRYSAWMDAFQEVTGSKLAFFECDTGPSVLPSGWMNDVVSLRAETSARNIPLGIIYDGLTSDSSDTQWIMHAQNLYTDFVLSYGQPDQAIFQSWNAFPMHALPETTPYTFTWLIDQYTLPYPSLSLTISGTQAAGKLVDAEGNGIASAPVSVTMQPTSGAGIVATYTLTGAVPAAISAAVIQICVNQCGSQGTNNMSVYSFQYTDSGNQWTFNFSKGLTGWGVEPSGNAPVQLGSDANGPYLSVSATAAQSTYVNSPSVFAVTPGSTYTLTVTARISPDSTASGYFGLIFLTGPPCSTLCSLSTAYSGVSRDTLAYAPDTVRFGTAQTGSDGSYSLQLSPPSAGTYQLQASFAGSAVFWPALASIVLDAGLPSCTFAVSPGGQGFTSAGGTGSVSIAAPAGCSWFSTDTLSWVMFFGDISGNGTGNGTITYQVSPNSGADRSGALTIAGVPYTVEQEAASASIPGLNFIGSLAHLAAEENWTTAFTLVNKSTASATARLSLFGDASEPSGNGPLSLPLAFPQQPSASGPLLAASLDQTILASASVIIDTAGPQTPPVLVGSAQLAATGAVDGFAIFHQIQTAQEAVVPMETRKASAYLLAFDNTKGLSLGVAVDNVSAQAAIIPVVIRDDTGAIIGPVGATISLGGNGHTSFVLSDPVLGFPVTANIRGTIEFDTPAGGQISVLGIRFTPPNNALTTIPALANVGTGGGSIAHLASGGDGWETTFVLVNTGTSPAQATLSFFADMTGIPQPLPLSFPQGNIMATTASSVTQTLAAGATLLIVSAGAPDLLTGSAQLTTTGNVSGFVIFRHNGQEAVVPLESRNAKAYLLAFDNTGGTFTGVAVNSVSTQAVNVPVIVRDDTGAQIATDTLNLAPNGHTQFTLVTDKYPATANIRGTIEFDAPTGAQIGALGIRTPAGAAHTYTTLPALAKQ